MPPTFSSSFFGRLFCSFAAILWYGPYAITLISVFSGVARAQGLSRDIAPARSQSGQFIVQAEQPYGLPAATPNLTANLTLLQLEPKLVTISCDRIKDILSRELGATASWRGKVFLALRPVRAVGQTITVTSEKFRDGWQYRVDLPDVVERARYVRAIVQVLLLEMANRTANSRLAEIPLWLTEGLSQQLLASSETEIILQLPRETRNGLTFSTKRIIERKENKVDHARKKMGARSPVTFEQLSWQAEDELSGGAAELYRASAQLFVAELLRLPDGRASLRTMLAELPRYHNWQFAFLHAFRAHFERPLDVEKWWALCLAQSVVPEHRQTWTSQESWEKLDQTIRVPMPSREGITDQTPAAAVTLQTIIQKWDRTRQTYVLTRKLRELQLLRSRVAPELVVLVQEYCQTLETHLQNQTRTGIIPLLGKKASLSRINQETLRRLDALDGRCEALRPAPARIAAGGQSPAVQPAPNP